MAGCACLSGGGLSWLNAMLAMLCVKTTPQPQWPAAGSMACDEQGVEEEYHVLLSCTFAFSPDPAFGGCYRLIKSRYEDRLIRVP